MTLEILKDTAIDLVLQASVSAVRNVINVDQRLRLLGSVSATTSNGVIVNLNSTDYTVTVIWSEANGFLSISDIQNARVNTQNSYNLVLKPDSLEKGHTYVFLMTVSVTAASTSTTWTAKSSVQVS